jgi:hypothetical protein
MPTALRDVRSHGQSGKNMLALSFSGFDPERKSSLANIRHPPANLPLAGRFEAVRDSHTQRTVRCTQPLAIISKFATIKS